MPQLDFVNVSTTYKVKRQNVEVLKDVSFSVPNGAICVLVGPSGCGKTTLLRIAAGTKEYAGDFRIDGYEMRGVQPRERNLSWINQEYILYPHLTIYDNLAFPLKSMRVPFKEINKRVLQLADELGLSFLLTRKPKHLSGGQQQKVAIARALIKNPSYILLDEPLSNLDPLTRNETRDFIRTVLSERNITAIYVTHDTGEALFMGDVIVTMGEGVVEKVEINKVRHPEND